ncbi:MAG: hypothetical protein IJM59_06025 [Proteobacteria bacterium]|nr:hypothetical protein [Pseudomonadota bacterium]
MLTIASAYSKFILSGEHFVVDGTPSVVIPGTCFSTQISLLDTAESSLSVQCVFDCEQPELQDRISEYESFADKLIRRAAGILGIQLNGCGLRCIIKSMIPPGQGAGSSSALCQVIMEAMLKHFLADDFHPNYLKWFGTLLENTWHGPVSGIDNAAIAYRRMLFYQRNSRPEPIVPGCPLFFVVGTAGPRQGINPYQSIRWLRENHSLQYASYRKVMTDNARKLAESIRIANLLGIGECMNESHELFNAIGIVPDSINKAVQKAKSLGALGARMTGAGGGGFVIACVPVNIIESLQIAWRELGLRNIRTLQFGLETLG